MCGSTFEVHEIYIFMTLTKLSQSFYTIGRNLNRTGKHELKLLKLYTVFSSSNIFTAVYI